MSGRIKALRDLIDKVCIRMYVYVCVCVVCFDDIIIILIGNNTHTHTHTCVQETLFVLRKSNAHAIR